MGGSACLLERALASLDRGIRVERGAPGCVAPAIQLCPPPFLRAGGVLGPYREGILRGEARVLAEGGDGGAPLAPHALPADGVHVGSLGGEGGGARVDDALRVSAACHRGRARVGGDLEKRG